MSQFLSPLRVELVLPHANDGVGQWQLVEPFQYYSSLLKRAIEVPMGFSTDFASVPKNMVTWGLYGGRYARPAVVHDYLCRMRDFKRERVDRVFLEAMHLENKFEVEALIAAKADNDEIVDRKAELESRAQAMYAAVVLYTKSGLWKKDFDRPGYHPVK